MATQDQNFGAAYVDECIHCIADLERFAERCVQDPLLGANVFKNGSWELFDKVYAMSDDHSISSKQQTIMLDLVGHICDHARPREVVLMVLEKISGCTDVFPFLLLLHAMLHIITKSDSTSMWNQGLDAVCRKSRMLTNPVQSLSEAEVAHSDDEEESNRLTNSKARQLENSRCEFVKVVLDFTQGLVLRVSEGSSVEPNRHQQPITNLLITFLLNLNATVIVNIADPTKRKQYIATTSMLLIELTGDMFHIFSHIYRVRHAVHRQKMSESRAQFLRHYCNKHTATQKDPYASTALTTDDANALLNRISQSEYCGVLVSYFDQTTTAANVVAAASSTTTRCNGNSITWAHCVHWDDVLNHFRPNESVIDDKDATATNEDLLPPWNLTGIALFALHVLQATESPTYTSANIYNRAQLVRMLQPYVLLLLRDNKFANPEGLQLASLAMPQPSQGTQTVVPVFMSFLAQQTSDVAYSHLMLSFYNCLPSRQKNVPGKVFWEAQDATKLGILSAATNNILALTQTLITAMASCADSALRTASFNSLRAHLKNIEERSLFGLLLMLAEQCPYPNMAGLLIDLAKECVQAASRSLSWSHYPSTSSHLAQGATSSTASLSNANAAPLPWLAECTDPELRPVGKKRGFPLSKILKHKTPTIPSSAAELIASDKATSEEARSVISDIDELVLLSKKSRSPNSGPSPIDEHSYLDLRTGKTSLDEDKYVEVREALPFMHTGKSPFWSPLVLQRFVLEPLRDTLEHASPDKILECVDIIAARVNLVQAFALKCLSDSSLTSTAATESASGILDAYFAGSRLYITAGDNVETVFPYAYSTLAAVKDIFAVYFLLKQLRGALLRAQKSVPVTGAALETVRVQLLLSNVDYALGHVKVLCNKLHSILLQTAE